MIGSGDRKSKSPRSLRALFKETHSIQNPISKSTVTTTIKINIYLKRNRLCKKRPELRRPRIYIKKEDNFLNIHISSDAVENIKKVYVKCYKWP
jgi:hypothetical protein